MAATLPELCLHLIFKELKKDWKSQYACILVNRHWCISAIPKLWEDPFSFCLEFGQKNRYIQLVDTYIKCLSLEFQESVGLDLITKAIFDYTSFLRYFWPNDIRAAIKVWLDTKIVKTAKKGIVSVIFKALCENFIINSTYIEGIYLSEKQIINIFELTKAEEKLSNITYLDCLITEDKVGYLPTFLLSASRILKNLKEIKIVWTNDDTPLDLTVKNMAQLIKNQKRLEDITITCLESDFPIIWTNVLEHHNVLTSLQLNFIKFSKFDPFPLHELSIFSNLQQLEIIYCGNFIFSTNEIDLSLSFQRLNKISIIMNEREEFSIDFIEILLMQSNEKIEELTLLLGKICKMKNILYNCKNYCTKLIKLDYSISDDIIISFLSYLESLKYLEILSLKYSEYYFRGDLLFLIGHHLPKSTINFTYDLDDSFHIDFLSTFFEICKAKEIKFKVLNFSDCSFFNDNFIYLLLEYYGNGQLDELYLNSKEKFSKKCIEDIKKHVRYVKFPGDDDEKYQLSDNDYNELY